MQEMTFPCLCFRPQRGGSRRGEGEPAAETVHVSVRLQQLAHRPVDIGTGTCHM